MTLSRSLLGKDSPFAFAPFRRLYAANWFSTMAFWMLRVGLSWMAWDISESSFWTGFVASLAMLPTMVLAPVCGVIVDRLRPQRIAPFIFGGYMTVSLMLVGFAYTESSSIAVLCCLAAAYGLLSALYGPVRMSLPALIVPRRKLPSVVGLTSIVFHASAILGPALAGLLLVKGESTALFLTTTASILIYLAIFSTIAFPSAHPSAEPLPGFRTQMTDGLKVAWALPGFSRCLVVLFFASACARPAIDLAPAVVSELTGADSSRFAALVTAAGIGAMAAGFAFTRIAHRMLALILNLAGALAGVSVIAVAISGDIVTMGGLFVILGFFTTSATVAGQSLFQIMVPDGYRGRVLSLWSAVAFGGHALGALGVGWSADAFGMAASLAAAGTICAFVSLAALGLKGPGPVEDDEQTS